MRPVGKARVYPGPFCHGVILAGLHDLGNPRENTEECFTEQKQQPSQRLQLLYEWYESRKQNDSRLIWGKQQPVSHDPSVDEGVVCVNLSSDISRCQ